MQFFIILLILLVLAVLFYFGVLHINNPSTKAYPVRGVDVSSYQGEVDCDTLSQQNIRLANNIADGKTIDFQDDKDIDDIIDFLGSDPKFYDMKIDGFIQTSDLYEGASEAYGVTQNNDRLKKQFDADEIANVNLKVEIGGKDYIMFMTMVRYGNKWYNAEFSNIYYLMMNYSPMYGGLALKEDN